jgi:boron transporter
VPKWWKIRLFRGMINDVRRRLPFYWSDWTDAWDYRVIPATVYMYFAKSVSLYYPIYRSGTDNT